MELYLNNYVWLLVALASVCFWLRLGQCTRVNRRLSFIGLFLFIVILFLVISVSDDLWSIQNPAQAKTLQRRDDCETRPHSAFTAITALPESAVAELSFGFQRLDASLYAPLLAVVNPALNPVQNRPPPQA